MCHGEDANWIWLAMELAEGGDLFDKIEADEGVGQDVAHLYFAQLVAAISWCHGKGVAHRDVKPENMLLSAKGDLKLADFGLATQFLDLRSGARKLCGMVCGSPPYIAPEILAVGQVNLKRKAADQEKAGYDPQAADVWSCAIVLFVLFAGNTPWDAPVAEESYEFNEYVSTNGRPTDELWEKVPPEALSLLRGMLKTEVAERMSVHDVHKHPWFTRPNPHLSKDGRAADPLGLATQMLEKLHIDFSKNVPSSQGRQSQTADAMHLDATPKEQSWTKFSSTQPETPTADLPFDWEAPPRLGAASASQPTNHDRMDTCAADPNLISRLCEDPSMSQFTATPAVPMSLTQLAREFNDILPSSSLARFPSAVPLPQLVDILMLAFHRLRIPVPQVPSSACDADREEPLTIRVKTLDATQQPLHGSVVVQRIGGSLHEVRFVKAKGDPLGWRRLFKHVAILCKDAIIRSEY